MVSETKHRSLVTLNIYSRTLSTVELEELVPFPSDWARQKGEPRGRQADNTHPHSVVAYESHVDRSAGITAHLDDLLGRLEPAKRSLSAFAQHAKEQDGAATSGAIRPPAPVMLWVNAESTDATLGFGISNAQLKAICDLGAYLAIEIESDTASIET